MSNTLALSDLPLRLGAGRVHIISMVKADCVIFAHLAPRPNDLRELGDTLTRLVCPSGIIRAMPRSCGPQELWEEQADDGPQGGETGAHNPHVQFDG